MWGANEITRLAERKAKLREAALLMRLFGVTHSPAHPCWRRHLQRGVCCSEEGSPGSTRGVSPTPYFPKGSNTLTRAWPQCCPVCALPLWKGYPTLTPLGQPTSITTQPPLNKNERQQNKTHSTNGKGMARHRPKAAKKGASHSVSQWCHPHCKAQVPACYSSDCEREMRGPLRISFRFSSFFLLFSSSRSAF